MKAFVLPRPGATEIEPAELPVPSSGDEELLLRVHAVGVGIHDSFFLPGNARYPYPIGIEAVGVLERVGSGVTGHRPGDRVAVVSAMQPRGGTWAEFAAIGPGSLVIPIPPGVVCVQVAAVPVAGNTVFRALRAVGPAPADNGYLLGLGAEFAVDYRAPNWPGQVRHWSDGGVDAAVAVRPERSGSSSSRSTRSPRRRRHWRR